MPKETKAEKSRRLVRKWKQEGRCIRCGGIRDDQRYFICSPCREKQHVALKRMKDRRQTRSVCFRCGKNKVRDGYRKCEECEQREHEWRKTHPEYAERQRKRYQAVKDEVFRAYGGYVCTCCGETEPMFLCIDHIDGGGEAHRTSIGVGSRGRGMYTWLKKQGFPPGFRVLCQNCNIGTHLNGGVCPHKRKNND